MIIIVLKYHMVFEYHRYIWGFYTFDYDDKTVKIIDGAIKILVESAEENVNARGSSVERCRYTQGVIGHRKKTKTCTAVSPRTL